MTYCFNTGALSAKIKLWSAAKCSICVSGCNDSLVPNMKRYVCNKIWKSTWNIIKPAHDGYQVSIASFYLWLNGYIAHEKNNSKLHNTSISLSGTEISSHRCNQQYTNFLSNNGKQTTSHYLNQGNNSLIYWCTYASLGLNGLTHWGIVSCVCVFNEISIKV